MGTIFPKKIQEIEFFWKAQPLNIGWIIIVLSQEADILNTYIASIILLGIKRIFLNISNESGSMLLLLFWM